MARHAIRELSWEELALGDEWESAGRTITEADVVAFAGLSGDFNAIHVDHERARGGPFGRPIAHGLLGLAVASGLASQAPRVRTLALLGYQEWFFRDPITAGDTVHVVSQVVAVEPRSRGRRALVTWHRQLVNQRGQVVQEGRIQTLIDGQKGRSGADEGGDEPA